MKMTDSFQSSFLVRFICFVFLLNSSGALSSVSLPKSTSDATTVPQKSTLFLPISTAVRRLPVPSDSHVPSVKASDLTNTSVSSVTLSSQDMAGVPSSFKLNGLKVTLTSSAPEHSAELASVEDLENLSLPPSTDEDETLDVLTSANTSLSTKSPVAATAKNSKSTVGASSTPKTKLKSGTETLVPPEATLKTTSTPKTTAKLRAKTMPPSTTTNASKNLSRTRSKVTDAIASKNSFKSGAEAPLPSVTTQKTTRTKAATKFEAESTRLSADKLKTTRLTTSPTVRLAQPVSSSLLASVSLSSLVPKEVDSNEMPSTLSGVKEKGKTETEENSLGSSGNLLIYFFIAVVIFIGGYIIYHNRLKLIILAKKGFRSISEKRKDGRTYKRLPVVIGGQEMTDLKSYIY